MTSLSPAPALARLVLPVLLAFACSSNGGGASDGGAPEGGGAHDAGGGAGATGQLDSGADMGSAPSSCLDIRTCASACADATCVQACKAPGTSAAQSMFADLAACLMTACPTGDPGCLCDSQCFTGGACADLVDSCVNGGNDPVCLPCR
jgi:hypothetical protein